MTRYLFLLPIAAVLISCTPPTTKSTAPATTTSTTSTTIPTTTIPADSSGGMAAAPAVEPPQAPVGAVADSHVLERIESGDVLACIRRYESGNDYRARNGHGHSGAYQFDAGTWRSVGGTGEAADASPEEQDSRAAELMRRRGLQPWSVRERCQ